MPESLTIQDVLLAAQMLAILNTAALLLLDLQVRPLEGLELAAFDQVDATARASANLPDRETSLRIVARLVEGGADPLVRGRVDASVHEILLLVGLVPELLRPVGGHCGFAVAALAGVLEGGSGGEGVSVF